MAGNKPTAPLHQLMDTAAGSNHAGQRALVQPRLFQTKADCGDRVRRADRVMRSFVRLDQTDQDLQLVTFGRSLPEFERRSDHTLRATRFTDSYNCAPCKPVRRMGCCVACEFS